MSRAPWLTNSAPTSTRCSASSPQPRHNRGRLKAQTGWCILAHHENPDAAVALSVSAAAQPPFLAVLLTRLEASNPLVRDLILEDVGQAIERLVERCADSRQVQPLRLRGRDWRQFRILRDSTTSTLFVTAACS